MAFRVGMKVVCVKEGDGTNMAKVGHVYTIHGFVRGWHSSTRTTQGLLFVEIPAPAPPYLGYAASRFRPIVERKTDTGFAILTEILNGQRMPEKVS